MHHLLIRALFHILVLTGVSFNNYKRFWFETELDLRYKLFQGQDVLHYWKKSHTLD